MNGEQFEAHPVWQSLAGLQSEIEQDFEPTNQQERDAVRRLHAVADFVDKLRDVDPALSSRSRWATSRPTSTRSATRCAPSRATGQT